MERIVLGDLHGHARGFRRMAIELGLCDRRLKWKREDCELILLGDVCDRGYDSCSIYRALLNWQREAPDYGSRVSFLLGNHEVMNFFGLTHYSTRKEEAGYGPEGKSSVFSPGGWLFNWLSGQPFIIQRGTAILAHGDFVPAYGEWALAEIEERVEEQLRRALRYPGDLLGYKSLFDPEHSLLWCRSARYGAPGDYQERLTAFLKRHNASVYICGHTPELNGRFVQLYGGRYLCIDTAMVFSSSGGGALSALRLTPSGSEACYWAGEEGRFRREPLKIPKIS